MVIGFSTGTTPCVKDWIEPIGQEGRFGSFTAALTENGNRHVSDTAKNTLQVEMMRLGFGASHNQTQFIMDVDASM
jgi:hypothetical protein